LCIRHYIYIKNKYYIYYYIYYIYIYVGYGDIFSHKWKWYFAHTVAFPIRIFTLSSLFLSFFFGRLKFTIVNYAPPRRRRQRGGFIFLSGTKIPESTIAYDFVDWDIDRSLGVLPDGGELKPVEFRRRRHAKNDLDSTEIRGDILRVIHEWKQSENPRYKCGF